MATRLSKQLNKKERNKEIKKESIGRNTRTRKKKTINLAWKKSWLASSHTKRSLLFVSFESSGSFVPAISFTASLCSAPKSWSWKNIQNSPSVLLTGGVFSEISTFFGLWWPPSQNHKQVNQKQINKLKIRISSGLTEVCTCASRETRAQLSFHI